MKSHLSPHRVLALRNLLTFHRQSLLADMEALEASRRESAQADPHELGDWKEESQERQRLLIEDDRLQLCTAEKDEVDAALRRLDGGAYGICENCRQQISLARLLFTPTARRCSGCQEEKEKAPGHLAGATLFAAGFPKPGTPPTRACARSCGGGSSADGCRGACCPRHPSTSSDGGVASGENVR